MKTWPTSIAIEVLEDKGIRTIQDLDAYRHAHPEPDGTIESRYRWLCRFVGEDAADGLTNELMKRQCF